MARGSAPWGSGQVLLAPGAHGAGALGAVRQARGGAAHHHALGSHPPGAQGGGVLELESPSSFC